MSELANLLRLMVQGDKEAVVTEVVATDTPAKFTTALTSGQRRRRLLAHNVTAAGSGEAGYGYDAAVHINDALILPKAERIWIPVAEAVDVYFVAGVSGETNISIRVEEIA